MALPEGGRYKMENSSSRTRAVEEDDTWLWKILSVWRPRVRGSEVGSDISRQTIQERSY